MRVLQAMAGAKFGGAEKFFIRLAGGLARFGIEQRIIIREDAAKARGLRAEGIEPVQLLFGGTFDWQTGRSLKLEVKKFKPDIVLTWMNRATSKFPKGNFVHVGRLGGYYNLKYYKKCDHLIGNTEHIVEYIAKKGWARGRAHFLPNFVNTSGGAPISRQELFTPNGAPLIFAMGRLHENKAFDVLFRALTRLPDAYLWVAGDGPLKGKLEQLAIELGIKPRVRFLGWRDDTSSLLCASDIFVCPSRHEPLGNVVIEAWAHGKPVVAAESSGPSVLIDHLESGILVPKEDEFLLSKAIKDILLDKQLRERISAKGFEVFSQNYTEQKVVGQYVSFFEDLIGS